MEFINKFLTKNYLKGLIVGSIKDERALEMWKGLTKKTINSLGIENNTLISKERILNLSNKSINVKNILTKFIIFSLLKKISIH